MPKLILDLIANAGPSGVAKINENFDRLEDAIENTLSRDGTLPNQMNADLDLNNFDLLNVGIIDAEDVVIDGGTVTGILERANEAIVIAEAAADTATDAAVIAAQAAIDAQAAADLFPDINLGDAGKYIAVNNTENGFELRTLPTPPVAPPANEISVKNVLFGAVGNGTADDTAALQAALDYARTNNVALFMPTGRYRITAPLTFHTTSAAVFRAGLHIRGEGHRSSVIVNNITGGGIALSLYSVNNGTYQQGGYIGDIGFESQSSGANSHGIRYEGTWSQTFERVRMEALNGAGFKVTNPGEGDGKASAHVLIKDCYLRDNVGPAWDSAGGNGGITLHTLENNYIVGNGGTAQVVIDGVIHFVMRMCSVAAFGSSVPLVRVLKTNLTSQTLRFEQGEYGNGSGVHFAVDSVVNFKVDGIRHVRRPGENTSLFGYYFSGTGGGVAKGVDIQNIQVEIDHASPAWTLLYNDAANAEISVRNVVSTSFASGNQKYNITGSGLNGKYELHDFDGTILYRKPMKIASLAPSGTSTVTPDLITSSWYKIIPSGAGTTTIAVPSGPKTDGSRITISVYKTATILISFNAAYTIRDTIPNDTITTLEFVYDASSLSWRQI